MAAASDTTAREQLPGGGKITKRVARPDTGEHAVVVELVVGIVQVELAVVGVTVHVDDTTVAVRVLPKNVRKVISTTAPRCRASYLEADSSELYCIWDLPYR